MIENKTTNELIIKQNELLKSQLKTFKLLNVFVVVIMCFVILVVVSFNMIIMPKISIVLDDTMEITATISELDIDSIASDITTLIETSNNTMLQAVDKLDSMDVESLNKAIEDLQIVVGPIAKLFD